MKTLKTMLKKRFPAAVRLSRSIRRRRWRTGSLEEKFTWIYQNNFWKSSESVSGTGSSFRETLRLRQELPNLLRKLQIGRLLDVPCGDFHWMREVVEQVPSYIGGDVVEPLIERNNQMFGSASRQFLKVDLTTDRLPSCDLILCRDCLVHLSLDDIWNALHNFASADTKYLLLTSFVDTNENADIPTGAWRKINLEAPPFCLLDPVLRISEESREEDCQDKSLVLWEIETVKRCVATNATTKQVA